MLDRLKKILIAFVISASLTGFALSSQSTISYVNINNLAYQDVEIVITDDNKMLVPFKQLADLFDIKYTANRVDKFISFTTFDGKQGMINQNGIFVDDYPITTAKPIFLTAGIIDGVFNEAYVPASVVEQTMDVKLETDFENLSINATVLRNIPVLRNASNLLVAEDSGPHAYPNIVAPKKPAKITLNTIGLKSYFMDNNMVTQTQVDRNSSNTFNGTTQLSINGDIYGGRYRIEASEYNYRDHAFMFGGVTGTYANKFSTPKAKTPYWYELGKVTGRTDEYAQIGTNIFGGQFWNYDYNREKPSNLHGIVDKTSTVKLFVNDLEPQILSTYAGYFTLKDVQLPNPVTYIKLVEVHEDGTETLIREEKYNVYKDKPFEKENRYSAYAGVWGYENRLFREGGNIYRGNNKKVTGGGYYQRGLKDNLTFESKLTADKIYKKESSETIYTVPTNDSLLVSGTQKSVNYLEGATSLNSVNWEHSKNPDFKASAVAGISYAHDIRDDRRRLGYIVKAGTDYTKNLEKYKWKIVAPKSVNAKLEGFHSSPDFYIASSDSTAQNDKTGGKVSGAITINSTSVNGSYSKYYSNIDHRYDGGTLDFDKATLNASTKIPKVADLRFSSNFNRGRNDLGKNINYYYDANISRYFGSAFMIEAGRRESKYDTTFNVQTSENRNYLSKYSDDYIMTNTVIPGGNRGKFQFGHSFVRYNTLDYENGYNIFRFGYIFPTWKNITLGVNWGLKYYGQTGNDIGGSISYRARSGQTITAMYQYSNNSGYFIDNMFTPSTNRHTVSVSFNDAFQLFNHGLKSIGVEDLNRGIFEVQAFIDVDKDGKYNKKVDIPIKDVPIMASWTQDKYLTNKRGRVSSPSVEQGVYKVSIDMDNLPITVAPATNDLVTNTIRIDGGQTTKLAIPLVSTVGSISGNLKISDDFDRNLKITDFVVVLLDAQGNEVAYSTLGESGDFYISGIAPGNYTLQLDERYIQAYGLETVEGHSSMQISIPFDYYTPVDLTDMNLEYKTLSL